MPTIDRVRMSLYYCFPLVLVLSPEIQISTQAQTESIHILRPAVHSTEFSHFKVIRKHTTFKNVCGKNNIGILNLCLR